MSESRFETIPCNAEIDAQRYKIVHAFIGQRILYAFVKPEVLSKQTDKSEAIYHYLFAYHAFRAQYDNLEQGSTLKVAGDTLFNNLPQINRLESDDEFSEVKKFIAKHSKESIFLVADKLNAATEQIKKATADLSAGEIIVKVAMAAAVVAIVALSFTFFLATYGIGPAIMAGCVALLGGGGAMAGLYHDESEDRKVTGAASLKKLGEEVKTLLSPSPEKNEAVKEKASTADTIKADKLASKRKQKTESKPYSTGCLGLTFSSKIFGSKNGLPTVTSAFKMFK